MTDTIAACASAWGRAGVAVIRISGPKAAEILEALSKKPPPAARQASLVRLYDADDAVLDQALALYFPAPASYTGEDVVELHCHGSPVIVEAVLARAFSLGARPAGPGEFTRRAVEHGKMDLTQAEAVAAAIDAATVRAAKVAQRQLAGAFGQKVEAWMDALLSLLAHLEAWLDFPDEDIPEIAPLQKQATTQLIEPMRRALARAPFGERLLHGATVAIVGEPNVGKSSLLNRIVGEERAIVTDIPGTTRDVVEADFSLRGIPVRLADTAGLRQTRDPVESIGVQRAQQMAKQADLVLLVVDARKLDEMPVLEPAPSLIAANKIDLLPAEQRVRESERIVPVSAKTGEGVARLIERMAALLGDLGQEADDLLITRARHRMLIEQAVEAIEQGCTLLQDPSRMDIAAAQWRRAYAALGEILGMGDVETLLDRIFSTFCIGK